MIRKRNSVLTLWDLTSASVKLVTRAMVKHAFVSNKLFHVFIKKILPFISDNHMLLASLFVSLIANIFPATQSSYSNNKTLTPLKCTRPLKVWIIMLYLKHSTSMQLVSGPHSYQTHSQGLCYLSPVDKYERSLRARLHSNLNCNKYWSCSQ